MAPTNYDAATSAIRGSLQSAGFRSCWTHLAELIEQDVPARDALASGALSRHVTSQLSDLSDAAYAEGMASMGAAAAAPEAAAGTLRLRARLHLFATVAHVNGGGA